MAAIETFRPAFADAETPKVSYGLPFPQAAAKHVDSTFNASRVYIISSGSLARNTHHLSDLQEALGKKVVGTRVGMKPHTLWSKILEITREARACNADLLITLGAGSLTDGAKIVSFVGPVQHPVKQSADGLRELQALANNVSTSGELATLTSAGLNSTPGRGDAQASKVPIVCIPTSLSGGEYSHFAGGTADKTRQKHAFSGSIRGPALVILDAALSSTTPEQFWFSTGIRAVDHCVETVCSLHSNPESDKKAEEGLNMLIPGLLRSKRDARDVEARHLCQLGVIEAMSAVRKGVPLGASHGIGHQLGPLGVGHGETSCILLPVVCKYNAAKGANVERQETVKEVLWKEAEAIRVFEEKGLTRESADLGDLLDAIIRALGMPRSLADVKVGRDQLDGLAEGSLHDRWVQTNPVPLLKKEQVLEVLEMVVG